jgi:hypothetical protein
MLGSQATRWSVTDSLREAEDDVILRIELKPHWINGWFLRLFAKPALIVGTREYPLSWVTSTEVEIDDDCGATVGVGIRYLRRGRLLGLRMTELPRGSEPHSESVGLTFRNGMLNHDPFVLVE